MNVMKTDLIKILHPLQKYLNRVEDEIKVQLYTGIPSIDEPARYLFRQGGKRIRASIVLLTSGLSGEISDNTISIAAAVEIIHAATLIHDDIIDQSLLRRGNDSVPHKWGNKISVLLGDYLYTLALNIALRDGDTNLFPVMVEGTREMVKGELYQLQYSNLEEINRDHYFTIIELKTARFMAACAKLGAIMGGFGSGDCEKLYQYGLNLGFAFQIIDDTLDLLEDNSSLGKDIGNDLKSGKITLPFIFLLEDPRYNARPLLQKYRETEDVGLWLEIKNQLGGSSAIDLSIRSAKDYVSGALDMLGAFPDSRYREMLVELSNFFINRDF